MSGNLNPIFQQALAPFMPGGVVRSIQSAPRVISAPIKMPNMAADTSKLKGLYEYQYESAQGTFIDCYLDYEEGYDGGDPANPSSEESYPESISLVYALVNGVDIAEFLEGTDTQTLIEDEALAAMQTDAFDERADLGEDRWNDREAA